MGSMCLRPYIFLGIIIDTGIFISVKIQETFSHYNIDVKQISTFAYN